MAYRFLVIGSDQRQYFFYKQLQSKHYEVRMLEQSEEEKLERSAKSCQLEKWSMAEAVEDSDVILLPVAGSAAYYNQMKDFLQSGQFVCGANILGGQPPLTGVTYIEYMDSDAAAYENAVATAEGTIALAITMSSVNLAGNESLVAGYGRCGEVLCEKLKALDSTVTVVERSADCRARAKAHGLQTMDFAQLSENVEKISAYSYIFNTVPALIFSEKILCHTKEDAVILDIASGDGGVDFKYCEKYGIQAKHALGLPGVYAPKTSAGILYDVLCQRLSLAE